MWLKSETVLLSREDSTTLAKNNPDYNKYYNCPKTAAAKFLGSVAGNQCAKEIVHTEEFCYRL